MPVIGWWLYLKDQMSLQTGAIYNLLLASQYGVWKFKGHLVLNVAKLQHQRSIWEVSTSRRNSSLTARQLLAELDDLVGRPNLRVAVKEF